MFTAFLFIPPADRKMRSEIATTGNGKTKRTTREFEATYKARMDGAMRELGIMDHLSFGDGDGKLDINIRRFGDDASDRSTHFFMEPMPPMRPPRASW